MHIYPDADHLTFRDARAHLAALCKADKARVILNFGRPVAILTPLESPYNWNPGPHDRSLAAARKRFNTALQELRTR